jgi:hypothetical protein
MISPLFIAKMADYAFGSNPPYALGCGRWLWGSWIASLRSQ